MAAPVIVAVIIAVVVACCLFLVRLRVKGPSNTADEMPEGEVEDEGDKSFFFKELVLEEIAERDDVRSAIQIQNAIESSGNHEEDICERMTEEQAEEQRKIPEQTVEMEGKLQAVCEREREVKGEGKKESEGAEYGQEQTENENNKVRREGGDGFIDIITFEKNQKGGGIMDPLIQVPVLIGEGSIQKMVESTVTLANPAVKIREIRARVDDLRTDVIQDKVIIQATLHKQIFYVGADAVIHHQTEFIPVSYFVDILGAAPGMNVTVTPTIEHVNYTLLDPTTVHQKVILVFKAVVSDTQLLEVIPGIGTPLYYVPQVAGQGSQQLIVETAVQLSNPAQKVDEITAAVKDITTDVITDKVVIQGILHKQIFYVGTDNIEYHQAEDVPFSLFVDVTGAGPGMNVQVKPVIETINYTLENETGLLQKVVMQFSVIVTQNTELNLLPVTGKTILAEQVKGEVTGQTLLQDIVTMERPAQKIRNIEAAVTDITCQVITNKVIIQGTVHKQIFYIGTDNIEYEQGEDVDFSFFVDLTGAAPGMKCIPFPSVESVIPELLSETQLLEKVVLKVDILVTSTVRLGVDDCNIRYPV
ncbi:DUF3794 domain-containing protein [Thermoanaerobacterium sp. DL9XJH110]|uniref:DUF3794 domain-containing protein n=1 Tax=Thermoanaerobacterium sp. DL9XJH110 TaxID=3386643 RepID=UPI003BB6CE86